MEDSSHNSSDSDEPPPAPRVGSAQPNGGSGQVVPSRLPYGTVTILNTDIVGSTALGRKLGEERYAVVRDTHHRLLRREIARFDGIEFKETGDGFWAIFERPADALRSAAACQEVISGPECPDLDPPLRVRMALHIAQVGPVTSVADYHSLDLHDAARLLGASNGGQALVSEAAEAVLRWHLPEEFILAERGVYRLRDAPAPQRLYEARWPTMPITDLPPPRAEQMRSPVLPRPSSRCIGREREVADIVMLLTDGGGRLVTLTGLGGSGKTRLAIESARVAAVEAPFSGAAWFVPLVDLTDPRALCRRVAETVTGSASGVGSDPWKELEAFFKPAADERSCCMLVLDNLEHLLPDYGAEAAETDSGADLFVEEALRRFPTLRVLATSRRLLGLPEEQEYSVLPLPVPDPAYKDDKDTPCDPAEIAIFEGIPAVKLFVDRATRAEPGFAVTARNARSVAELCARLEGIPLALELAAAWARMLTPDEMLAQIPKISTTRDKRIPERHRSVTAAMEGSYRLLDADQRRFLRRLAVFRGGWSVESACAVCDEPNALDLLADLRARSLVRIERVAVGESREASRYAFLETLRTFAEAKLAGEEPGEDAATRNRHRDHFAAFAETAEPGTRGAEQALWLARLAHEHQNLAAALGRCDQPARLLMASRLDRYWRVRGHLAEGRQWLADAADLDGDEHRTLRIRALGVAGTLALSAGDLDAAHALCTRRRDEGESAGDEESAGIALINLAIIASMRGDPAAAREQYEASLPLWRRLGRNDLLATVLSNLGAACLRQNELDSARQYLEESLVIQAEMGEKADPLLKANTLHNRAEVATRLGEYPTALRHLSDCMQIRLKLGDRSAAPNLILLLARIRALSGDARAAWLFGAGDAACRIAATTIPVSLRVDTDAAREQLRSRSDPETFDKEQKEGLDSDWDRILARVVEELAVSAQITASDKEDKQ